MEKYIFPTKNDNNSDSRSKYTFLEEYLVDPIIADICEIFEFLKILDTSKRGDRFCCSARIG